MAAAADDKPSFSELCRRARDLESRSMDMPIIQISDTMTLAKSSSIFPPELEDYTYAYALSEAHKVERKLFASSYSSQLSSSKPGMSEVTVEQELGRLSAQGAAPMPEQKKSQFPSFEMPKMPGIKIPSLSLGKKTSAPPQQSSQSQMASEQESTPPAQSDLEMARDLEAAGKAQMKAHTGLSEAPKSSQKQFQYQMEFRASPLKPPEIPAGGKKEEKEEDWESDQAIPPVPASEEFEEPSEAEKQSFKPEADLSQDESVKKQQESPLPSQSTAPELQKSSGVSTSSKLSPRLRAIIEEKMRREDEKEQAAKESQKAAQEKAAKEEPEEMPLEEGGLAAEPESSEEEGPAAESSDALSPLEQKAEVQEAKAQSARKSLIGKLEAKRRTWEISDSQKESPEEAGLSRAENEKEEALESEKESRRAEAEEAREEAAKKYAKTGPQSTGGMMIKPIFSGEEKKEEAPGQKEDETNERMKKIQRIIDELSPDKNRAAAIAPVKKAVKPAVAKKPVEIQKVEKEETIAPEEEAEKPLEPEPAPEPEPKEDEASGDEGDDGSKGQPPPVALPVSQKAAKVPLSAKKKPVEPAKVKKQPAAPAESVLVKKKGKGKKVSAKALAQKKGAKKKKALASESKKAAPVPVPAPKQMPVRPAAPAAPPRALPARPAAAAPAPKTLPVRSVPAPQMRALPVRPAADQPTPKTLPTRPAAVQPIAKAPVARVAPVPVSRAPVAPSPRIQPAVAPSPRKAVIGAEMASAKRERILPGGVRVRAETPKTYVPPARKKMPPQHEDKEETADEPEEGEKAASAQGSKKAKSQSASIKGPEEPSEEEESPSLARRLRTKEISGEASLPADSEEDDIEVPMPPAPEDEEAKPDDYEKAKQTFKEQKDKEDLKEKATAADDALLEQYAKDNLTWLYEIYKMGGMSREDFLQKARDKVAEDKEEQENQPSSEPPDNPALAALGKEIDKRYKR